MTSPALLTKELESAMEKLRRGLAYDPGKYRGAPDKRRIPGLEPEEAAALLAHIAALEQRVEADSKDAARYRWMRASGGLRFPTCIGELVPGYDFEAGIDARIAAESQSALPKEPR